MEKGKSIEFSISIGNLALNGIDLVDEMGKLEIEFIKAGAPMAFKKFAWDDLFLFLFFLGLHNLHGTILNNLVIVHSRLAKLPFSKFLHSLK